jgi:transposase
MGKRKRRTFSAEFKKSAVEMVISGGKRLQDVARELEIQGAMLSKWKSDYLQYKDKSFPGRGNAMDKDDELRQIRSELARVKEERDILKKAVKFFSRDT